MDHLGDTEDVEHGERTHHNQHAVNDASTDSIAATESSLHGSGIGDEATQAEVHECDATVEIAPPEVCANLVAVFGMTPKMEGCADSIMQWLTHPHLNNLESDSISRTFMLPDLIGFVNIKKELMLLRDEMKRHFYPVALHPPMISVQEAKFLTKADRSSTPTGLCALFSM